VLVAVDVSPHARGEMRFPQRVCSPPPLGRSGLRLVFAKPTPRNVCAPPSVDLVLSMISDSEFAPMQTWIPAKAGLLFYDVPPSAVFQNRRASVAAALRHAASVSNELSGLVRLFPSEVYFFCNSRRRSLVIFISR
jgi:hypothetical protein